MIRFLAPLVLVGLAACAPEPPPPAAFRPASGPIYSNAVYDPARLAGDWVQVATFAAPGAAPCARGRMQVSGAAGSLTHQAVLCLNAQILSSSGALRPVGPGRLSPETTDGVLAQDWWLLWVDVDYRTLVVGTPSGDFGFILDRSGSLPADRLTAAREVLDWNGYDLSRLVLLAP